MLLAIWAILPKMPKLSTVKFPSIPDAPDLEPFQSLVSLTVTHQTRLRGAALQAHLLEYLSIDFSIADDNEERVDEPQIIDLSALPNLAVLNLTGGASDCPLGGRSHSVTRVSVNGDNRDFVASQAFCDAFRSSVEQLTIKRVIFTGQDFTFAFPKLNKFVALECSGLDHLKRVQFPSLTHLSIRWPEPWWEHWEPEQEDVASFFSALNGENQTLKHLVLEFQFIDEWSRRRAMADELEEALTYFNSLLSFRSSGPLLWSRERWNEFAYSNPMLQALSIPICCEDDYVRVNSTQPSIIHS